MANSKVFMFNVAGVAPAVPGGGVIPDSTRKGLIIHA